MAVEMIADRTGHWWLCTRCGRSGNTERIEARATFSAINHRCAPEEVASASGNE